MAAIVITDPTALRSTNRGANDILTGLWAEATIPEMGEKIPFGWATDREGRPTDDPFVGFKGFLLPLGGHKGFGLSLMIDILCGVISGGAFQSNLESMYSDPDGPSGTSHTFIVIDPEAVLGLHAFEARMQEFYATLKASPMWEMDARMLLPGELEHESMIERRRNGIPVPVSLMQEIAGLAKAHDFDVPEDLFRVHSPKSS